MAKALLDNLKMNTLFQQDCGVSMTNVVKPGTLQSKGSSYCVKGSGDVIGPEWSTIRIGKHQVRRSQDFAKQPSGMFSQICYTMSPFCFRPEAMS